MFVYLNKQISLKIHAVLTGDIVNSTKLGPEDEKLLLKKLHQILEPYTFEFYRGDSFQAYLPDNTLALETALMCRTAAIGINPEAAPAISDVRIGIGIGSVVHPVRDLASAKGEAFLLSGRALDSLDKTRGRLVIDAENNPLANLAFAGMASYINSIYAQMTAKQAEVIFDLLRGETQQQVADKLNRSKSTISQHVTAGRWDEIEDILKNFKSIAALLV